MSFPIVRTIPVPDSAGVAAAQALTGSYATLGTPITVGGSGQIAIDMVFTPGENGNTLSFQLEGSPDASDTAEASSNWFPFGQWNDAAGTWTEEVATYTKPGATAATAYNCTTLEIPTTHQKIRIRVKDNAASSHGTAQSYVNLIPLVGA